MPFELHEVILVGCLAVFTAVAAVTDLKTRKIPNKLTVPLFVLGLIFQLIFHPYSPTLGGGLLDAAKAFAIGFGTLFVLWLIGGGGAGDTKMMGALSVWLGSKMTLAVLVLSTTFVLFGTVAVMAYQSATHGIRKAQKQFSQEALREKGGRRMMTYAFPVALATWIVLVWFRLLPHLAN
jgi:prepilin peptidase CpaA